MKGALGRPKNDRHEQLHQVYLKLSSSKPLTPLKVLNCGPHQTCQGQDNTSLVYLNDASILQNLKARHQECPVPRCFQVLG